MVDAELSGTIDLQADLSGTLDSGVKPLVPAVGLPLLDFGVVKIGPMFEIGGQAKATLELNIALNVGLSYVAKNCKWYLPASVGTNSCDPKSNDSGLKLDASANVKARAALEASVIPKLSLGISAFGGSAKGTLYVSLAASASLELSAEFSASTSKGRDVLGIEGVDSEEEPEGDDDDENLSVRSYVPRYPSASRDLALREKDIDWNACVDLKAGLEIKGGAEVSLFKIVNRDWSYVFYTRTFQIYKKCWGNAKRNISPVRRSLLEGELTALSCPRSGVGKKAPLVSEVVKGKDIKPV